MSSLLHQDKIKNDLRAARKFKLQKEVIVTKLRNTERNLIDKLAVVKEETENYQEQIMDIQKSISEAKYQGSMIEICKVSEKIKITAHLASLDDHKKGFDKLFNIEKEKNNKHNKELQEAAFEKQEMRRIKNVAVAKQNEEQLREAEAVARETKTLQRECAVLKKRNRAIMLKLRKKLLETENLRRDLVNKTNNMIQAQDEPF